jgi:hypothetical protein
MGGSSFLALLGKIGGRGLSQFDFHLESAGTRNETTPCRRKQGAAQGKEKYLEVR